MIYLLRHGLDNEDYIGGHSDVDLIVSTSITGLKFYGLVERLRVNLNKKVDVLDINQLVNNKDLLNEILKDGIKIYENKKR